MYIIDAQFWPVSADVNINKLFTDFARSSLPRTLVAQKGRERPQPTTFTRTPFVPCGVFSPGFGSGDGSLRMH